MYIQRHLVVYSKITLKILYILRHLCVYPKPTIDLYIETRLPDCSAIDGSAPGAAGRRKRSDTEPVEASLDKVFDPAKKLKYENMFKTITIVVKIINSVSGTQEFRMVSFCQLQNRVAPLWIGTSVSCQRR